MVLPVWRGAEVRNSCRTSANGAVEFLKLADGNLRIQIRFECASEIDWDDLHARPTMEALSILFESQLVNGWQWIEPHEIAALTSAPILTDSAERDESGILIAVERVYWFAEYQVVDEIAELHEKGFVVFTGAE
jgi:hypothetical protein